MSVVLPRWLVTLTLALGVLVVPRHATGIDLHESDGWTQVAVSGNFRIFLPTSMEVQGGVYGDVAREMLRQKELSLPASIQHVVIQQRGLNELTKGSSDTFFRIVIDTVSDDGSNALCLTSEDLHQMNTTERSALEAALREQVTSEIDSSSLDIKLVEWGGMAVEHVNGMSALVLRYGRQNRDKPPVSVSRYLFFNRDRIHKVQVEFRERERAFWEAEATKALDTLKFVDRCQ